MKSLPVDRSDFKFFAKITKSYVDDKTGKRMIEGIASTPNEDSDEEIVLPLGLDTDYFKSFGKIKWEHDKPNMPPSARNLIGVPVEIEKTANYFWVKSELYDGIEEADNVWNIIINNPNHGIGQSIEGKIEKRDSRNPKVIEKAKIVNVVLTGNPKNYDTYISVVKSFQRGMTSESIEPLRKEDLDEDLTNLEYGAKQKRNKKGTKKVSDEIKKALNTLNKHFEEPAPETETDDIKKLFEKAMTVIQSNQEIMQQLNGVLQKSASTETIKKGKKVTDKETEEETEEENDVETDETEAKSKKSQVDTINLNKSETVMTDLLKSQNVKDIIEVNDFLQDFVVVTSNHMDEIRKSIKLNSVSSEVQLSLLKSMDKLHTRLDGIETRLGIIEKKPITEPKSQMMKSMSPNGGNLQPGQMITDLGQKRSIEKSMAFLSEKGQFEPLDVSLFNQSGIVTDKIAYVMNQIHKAQ